jgi:pimeloyl-ACP methyl ester carboxylesterase
MERMSTASFTTGTVQVPGAQLYYEVRGAGPLLIMIGNPMDAKAFTPLADLLATDHTVVTTDPRGINRSPVEDPTQDVAAEVRADDLSGLLAHLATGPAAVFGSSGGAVSALALAVAHSTQVAVVVAHEPPLHELLTDRDQHEAAVDDMIATYLRGDVGGAWGRFLADADIVMPAGDTGPVLPPEPDPQAAADERFFFEHLLRPTTRWQPDLDALRTGSTKIVVGIGESSTGQLCDRTSTALAAGVGVRPTPFPGGHVGFVENPETFATRLRVALGKA